MNKTAIKNFAIWARNKLIADIGYRARLMGITADGIHDALPQSTGQTEFYDIGTAEPYAITGAAIRQRRHLVELIQRKVKDTDYKTAYKYIIEEVAYTWFNRLIAVRFMEVNDYLPNHIRVLSSESGKMEPDLVTTPFDADLEFTHAEQQNVLDLKNSNKLDEVFRLLFIKQCNALNEILPDLFEKTNDYTELLLNLSVIDQDGVVYHLVRDIPEEDFDVERGGQVEIIGWLYQYYNTEPKNEAFAKKGKITKEEVPAVTQLFTPDWIVRYMVENSLGRLWIEHLRALDESADEAMLAANFGWKYYLPEAKQEPGVENQLRELRKERLSLTPEQITMIDPCMGSGHILVYAFEVLMQIYENAGYGQRDAARSILENNLYGLDIDERAFQLAYFAVMMKARQYNRRILTGEIRTNVCTIQESNAINRNHMKYFGRGMTEGEKQTAVSQLHYLLDLFTDAKEYGSILTVEKCDWNLLERFVSSVEKIGQISVDTVGLDDTAEVFKQIIAQGRNFSQKYDTVCTNPPYMAITNADSSLYSYVIKNYPETKADLYSVFITRCKRLTKNNKYYAMITQQSWLSLPSFIDMRKNIFGQNMCVSTVQLGSRAFDEISGEVVSCVSFTFRRAYTESYTGVYLDLQSGESESAKEAGFRKRSKYFETKQDNFSLVPNNIVVYDASRIALQHFVEDKPLKSLVTAKPGMQTSDNERFLRLWFEVLFSKIGRNYDHATAMTSEAKWFPYNKGIGFRKWYGNNDYIVNYYHDGEELKYWLVHNPKDPRTKHWSRNMRNYDSYFKEGITFTAIGNAFSARMNGKGYLFDTKGPMIFGSELSVVCGFVNSIVFDFYNRMLCKQITKTFDSINLVPFVKMGASKHNIVEAIVNKNLNLSKADWDSFETSWDFEGHPLVKNNLKRRRCNTDAVTIKECYNLWADECDGRFSQLKASEEELNRIFINIYGLQDELLPEVEEKKVTVCRADLQRDIKSLLSYAVGCMFGRYSLDVQGLAFAGEEWDAGKYSTFVPCDDNVIPITDEKYLENDILSYLCEWLKVVYGDKTLEENLDYIAKALGNKGDSNRAIIRNYFLNDFFKDHCQTYSVTGSGKRPIYWLFDSGKQNGFKALIYLHRYTANTIGNLRIDYLHCMQRIYESEISRMQDVIDHVTNVREVGQATKRRDKLTKQLKECREYDEKLAHLALSRIELDLDDGVKINYRKMQTANDGIFYEVLADSKNIMIKK